MSDFTGETPKPLTPETIKTEDQNVRALESLLKILRRNPNTPPESIFPTRGKNNLPPK